MSMRFSCSHSAVCAEKHLVYFAQHANCCLEERQAPVAKFSFVGSREPRERKPGRYPVGASSRGFRRVDRAIR